MSKVRKNITYMLCIVFAALVALACTMFGINNKANAADITADDFKVSKIGIRLIDDDATQSGVRFTVRAKTEILNFTDAKVTVYVLPQMFYLNGAHLKDGAAKASVIELGGEWSQDGEYSTAAAYIYDFPANNYGVKLLAEASLTYIENGTSVTKWTAITDGYSLTDVAKAAKENGVGGVDGYIVENVKITYNNADGTKISEETLAYGATLKYPTSTDSNKIISGWRTNKNTYWKSEWTAQGNMSLTADCIKDVVVDDCAARQTTANGTFALDDTVKALGYEKVYSQTRDAAKWQEHLSHVSIGDYKELRFALKSSAIVQVDNFAKGEMRFSDGNWLNFVLTNLGNRKWNVKIEGTAYNFDRTITDSDFSVNGECLCNILYHGTNGWGIGFISANGKQQEITVSVTELRGVMKEIEPTGTVVYDYVFRNKCNGTDSDFVETEGVTAPGFEKKFTTTKTGNYIPTYSHDYIGAYSSVRFAVKTAVPYRLNDFTKTNAFLKTYDGWTYWTITKIGNMKWNLTISFGDTEVFNYSHDFSAVKNAVDSLGYILYHDVSGGDFGFIPTDTASYTVECTELRGDIKVTGEIVDECVYGTTCNKGTEFKTSSVAAPEGFETVKECSSKDSPSSFASSADMKQYFNGRMSHTDIQSYEEVHFAIKSSEYMRIDTATTANSLKQKYEDWLYFTLKNESTDAKVQWQVIVTYKGNEIVNYLNTRTITQPGVCGILWHGGADGTTPYGNGDSLTVYVTEIRGTKKSTLAKAGTTEYKIVVPDKNENLNNYGAATRAAGELKTFFKEATGADLGDYVQDTGNLGKDIKFISIGFTNTLNNNIEGVDYDALGISGFSIKTVNGNVYISGQGMGLMNGVYEFLREHFNYEYYTDGFYKIDDCTSKEIDLKIINEEITPSFEYRLPSYGFEISVAGGYATDNMVGYRMQYNNLSIQGIGGVQWHNFFAAIAPSEYKSAHSDWFSPDGKQLCLTRDKDGLATEIANKVKAVLESDKSATFVMIGQEDNDSWCTCSTCKKVISQYGGYNSATYILFMNAVSDKLQPYMTENGRTDVKLGMFAYHKTQDAPVTVANGKTTLIDGMKLNANVCVVYAPIEANYYVSFNDELNSSVKKNIEGWGLVADNVLYWTYMENFGHYQLVFDNFGSLQENLKLLSENNGLWLYNLAQYNNGNSTGFSRFKAYLNAKLMWNVNADVAALTDDFFKNYFGVASDDMRRIYNEYRAVNKMKFESDNTIGTLSINGHVPSAKDYGFSNLNGWLEDIDHALAEVEKLKGVDDKEYLRVKNAVILESLSIRYTLITYFGGNFDKTQLTAMKTAWKTDAAALNVTMCGEYKTVETLYLEWGI